MAPIIWLAVSASNLVADIRLTRKAERLDAGAPTITLRIEGDDACYITVDGTRIHCYIATDATKYPTAWEALEQSPNGGVMLQTGGSSLLSRTTYYQNFAAALADRPTEVSEIMWALGQPQCLCSMRYLRLRDGIEPLPQDGERDTILERCYANLEDADWRIREDATQMLIAMCAADDACAVWLSRQDLQNAPPEMQMRAEYVMELYPK